MLIVVSFFWHKICVLHDCQDLRFDVTYYTYKGDKKFIIALDYNLGRLIPNTTNFLNWLRQCFHMCKFPPPAVEFVDKVNFNMFWIDLISMTMLKCQTIRWL